MHVSGVLCAGAESRAPRAESREPNRGKGSGTPCACVRVHARMCAQPSRAAEREATRAVRARDVHDVCGCAWRGSMLAVRVSCVGVCEFGRVSTFSMPVI